MSSIRSRLHIDLVSRTARAPNPSTFPHCLLISPSNGSSLSAQESGAGSFLKNLQSHREKTDWSSIESPVTRYKESVFSEGSITTRITPDFREISNRITRKYKAGAQKAKLGVFSSFVHVILQTHWNSQWRQTGGTSPSDPSAPVVVGPGGGWVEVVENCRVELWHRFCALPDWKLKLMIPKQQVAELPEKNQFDFLVLVWVWQAVESRNIACLQMNLTPCWSFNWDHFCRRHPEVSQFCNFRLFKSNTPRKATKGNIVIHVPHSYAERKVSTLWPVMRIEIYIHFSHQQINRLCSCTVTRDPCTQPDWNENCWGVGELKLLIKGSIERMSFSRRILIQRFWVTGCWTESFSFCVWLVPNFRLVCLNLSSLFTVREDANLTTWVLITHRVWPTFHSVGTMKGFRGKAPQHVLTQHGCFACSVRGRHWHWQIVYLSGFCCIWRS